MTSTGDLFGDLPAPLPIPAAPARRAQAPREHDDWAEKALQVALANRSRTHIWRELKQDPALLERVLDAVEWIVESRLHAYERALHGSIDANAESFGWIARQSPEARAHLELLQRYQVEVTELPLCPPGRPLPTSSALPAP